MLAPRRGRPPGSDLSLSFKRKLNEVDFLAPRAGDLTSGSIIQRLKHRHHTAARGFAAGLSNSEISTLTGYSPARVSSLQNDPAFVELVTQYQNEIGDRVVDAAVEFQTRLLDTSRQALGLIQDRLDDDTEAAKIPVSELRQIVALGADRTVAPPKSAQPAAPVPTKITFNMGNKILLDETNEITIETSTPTLISGNITDVVEQEDDNDYSGQDKGGSSDES